MEILWFTEFKALAPCELYLHPDLSVCLYLHLPHFLSLPYGIMVYSSFSSMYNHLISDLVS